MKRGKKTFCAILCLALVCALAGTSKAVGPYAALEDIAYYGDRSKCVMSAEQAKAFEAVIEKEMARTDWGSKERNEHFKESSGKVYGYAALFDLGNGVPALFFARAYDSGGQHPYLEGGEGSIWTYDEGTKKASLFAKDEDFLNVGEKAIRVNVKGDDGFNVYFYRNGEINTSHVSKVVSNWYNNMGETKKLPDYYIDGKGATEEELYEWTKENVGQTLAGAYSGSPISADYDVHGLTPIDTVSVSLKTYITAAQNITLVQLHLNGGTGGAGLWTNDVGTVTVPTNPSREGYTFGGWYVDADFTTPWNFNTAVTGGLDLYARWVPVSSSAVGATQSENVIFLNGKRATVQAYNLVADANGGDVTYVKLRDLAALLDGTAAQFNVDWKDNTIYVEAGKPYTTRNGTELEPVIGVQGSYHWSNAPVLFDGVTKPMEGICLSTPQGDHTYFKLRDLAAALRFRVDWSAETGVVIETD